MKDNQDNLNNEKSDIAKDEIVGNFDEFEYADENEYDDQDELEDDKDFEDEIMISPVLTKKLPISNSTKPPRFTHSEINELYSFGVDIPHDHINAILALPTITLVEDLQKILDDAVERYQFFQNKELEDNTHSFVLHALLLLKELKVPENLSIICSFLEYEINFLNFWLGDHFSETLWMCFYDLGMNNTAVIQEFLLKPGVEGSSKSVASEALAQIVIHNPDKRSEILNIYIEVFSQFAKSKIEDNLIDSEFLGFAISDAIDCNFHELLPLIKTLYELDYVALHVCGDLQDVKLDFEIKVDPPYNDSHNIFECYEDVINNWGIDDDYSLEDMLSINHPFIQQAVSDKIGRNEPCPCGSGKKYKKCCLEN